MSWTAPIVVGRYLSAGRPQFLPLSETDVSRAKTACLRILDTYDLAPRSHVLVVSLASQVAYLMPIERALVERNMILSFADSSTFDATRVEMFIRRFDVQAVLGVTTETLDGFTQLGHDPATLFAGRLVVATPAAYVRLAPGNGYTLRCWAELGPAFGLECAAGNGLHVSSEDWGLDTAPDGELLVTSRWPRLEAFAGQPTGHMASIDRTACACGGTDARVRLWPAGEPG